MQTPVIFLVGPPHHGKTEARKLLSEITLQKGESTSTIIYHFLAARRGVSVESLKQLPKEELRPALIEAGDFIVGDVSTIIEPAANTEIDAQLYRIPSSLVRTLYMSGYNIIDGVRRKKELSEAIVHLEWNGVRALTFWIERPGTPVVQDNTELTKEDADETILNDGSLAELKVKLFTTLEKYFGKQDELQTPVPIIQEKDLGAIVAAAQEKAA